MRNYDGVKIWTMVAPLRRAHMLEWAETQHLPYAARTFSVVLRPGQGLIMPPHTVHAVYTAETSYMEGRMALMVADGYRCLRRSLLELVYPWVTNEEPAQQMVQKIEHLDDLLERHFNREKLAHHYREWE